MADELLTPFPFKEKRSEPRIPTDQFYSVEFFIPELSARYQFKLRDVSTGGIGIIVKNDSMSLDHLQVGNIMEMRYFSLSGSAPPESLKTRIEHISKCESGRYKGHHIVGFSIIEKNVINKNQL